MNSLMFLLRSSKTPSSSVRFSSSPPSVGLWERGSSIAISRIGIRRNILASSRIIWTNNRSAHARISVPKGSSRSPAPAISSETTSSGKVSIPSHFEEIFAALTHGPFVLGIFGLMTQLHRVNLLILSRKHKKSTEIVHLHQG